MKNKCNYRWETVKESVTTVHLCTQPVGHTETLHICTNCNANSPVDTLDDRITRIENILQHHNLRD